jgi:hypothetical protein
VSDSAPAERPLDLSRLLKALARHGVDYVVIGGVAVQVHGHRRTTMDLDLVPGPGPENLHRLASALDELEARPMDATPGKAQMSVADPERLAVAAIVPPLSTRHGQLHIVNEPKGARPFDDLRDAALVVEVEGIEIPIVALDDLLRMKRASGRPSDLEDIAALTAEESQEAD